jgi:hypothetical protein
MTMRFSGWKLAIFYSAPRELTPTLLRLCRAARCRHPDAVWFVSFSIQHEVNDLDTFVCVLGRRLNFERDCPELCFAGVLIQGREKDLHKAASLGHVFAMSEQFIKKKARSKTEMPAMEACVCSCGFRRSRGIFLLRSMSKEWTKGGDGGVNVVALLLAAAMLVPMFALAL